MREIDAHGGDVGMLIGKPCRGKLNEMLQHEHGNFLNLPLYIPFRRTGGDLELGQTLASLQNDMQTALEHCVPLRGVADAADVTDEGQRFEHLRKAMAESMRPPSDAASASVYLTASNEIHSLKGLQQGTVDRWQSRTQKLRLRGVTQRTWLPSPRKDLTRDLTKLRELNGDRFVH
jgi:hypothetical protein